jgi:hypothetical protein
MMLRSEQPATTPPAGSHRLNLLLSCTNWRQDNALEHLPPLLTPLGIHSITASSGEEAAEVIQKFTVHIAVVDLSIPLQRAMNAACSSSTGEAGPRVFSDAQKDAFKRTIGGGLSGTWKIALFEPDEKKRHDCGVRHSLAHLLQRGWHLETSHAWIFEGLGLYLTREICGTRLTWFCTGSGVTNETKNSPRAKLIVGDVNWMNEAYLLLTRENPVELATVLGRDLTTMGVEDVLVSYALAAYLVEGRPDAISSLLAAIGADTPPPEAIQKSLGMTVPELQERLVRWLSERK